MMRITSNMSAEERERIAYMSGDTGRAQLLGELDEVEMALDAFHEHGVYGESDLQQLLDDNDSAEKRASEAEDKLSDALDLVFTLKDKLSEALRLLADPNVDGVAEFQCEALELLSD